MDITIKPSPLFLVPSMALQVSCGSGTTPHRHIAAQIVISLEHKLSVKLSPKTAFHQCDAVLVPPNVAHHIAGPGPMSLMIWLDPATPGARAMRQHSEADIIPVSHGDARFLFKQIEELCSTLKTNSDAKELIGIVIQSLLPDSQAIKPLDERILFILSEMKCHSLLRISHPLSELARGVSLSESRLRHLFRRELGVPLQQYWVGYRLLTAIRQMKDENSLTEVAYNAGFSDLAHFSRAFRASFGIPPSFAQKDSHFIQALFSER